MWLVILLILIYPIYLIYDLISFFWPSRIKKNFSTIHTRLYYNYSLNYDHVKFQSSPSYYLPVGTKSWLKSTNTTGLVVLKVDDITKARILYQDYSGDPLISWSLNKSFVSALVGIAVDEGRLKLTDRVGDHLDLGGFNDCTIEELLEMKSGVKFDENYFNTFSDINMMCSDIFIGYNVTDHLRKYNKGESKFYYSSADTQALTLVLKAIVGDLTDYFNKKLWRPCGMIDDCYWLTDSFDNELGFGGLCTQTINYAIFGWLYLNKGKSPKDGQQIIYEDWIKESTSERVKSDYPNKFGYGYQWWVINDNEYLAIGIYGQFIYVNREYKIVIAKNSATSNYGDYERGEMINLSEIMALERFREISEFYKDV